MDTPEVMAAIEIVKAAGYRVSKMQHPSITKAVRDQVIAGRAAEKTNSAIAADLGLTKDQVAGIIWRHNNPKT